MVPSWCQGTGKGDLYHKGWLLLVYFDPFIVPLFWQVAVPSVVRCCIVFLAFFLLCFFLSWASMLEEFQFHLLVCFSITGLCLE